MAGGGDPGWIRTSDLVLRRHLLYPTELRGRKPTEGLIPILAASYSDRFLL